jgi:hypothetical protein
MLSGIFGHNREEVAGSCRRMHNEELQNLHTSSNIVRVIKSTRIRWVGYVARIAEIRNVCNILVGKPKGKRPLRRFRCKWEGNTRMDFREIRWKFLD